MAQSPTVDAPAFEVATVRRVLGAAPASNGRVVEIDSQQARFHQATLGLLIMRAWDIGAYQLSAPDWVLSERYEIAATLPKGALTSLVPAMLKTLLTERFRLETHIETRERAGYVLEKGKGPLKLQPTSAPDVPRDTSGAPSLPGIQAANRAGRITKGVHFGPGYLRAGALSLGGLAHALSNLMDSPVIDATGIEGAFDFDLQIGPR
jgi:uncharacterized protein (TIGR03435 family)